MKNYMSKLILFILILGVHTAWAETRMMACVPDTRLFVNVPQSWGVKPYTIKISYDTNKFNKRNSQSLMSQIAEAEISMIHILLNVNWNASIRVEDLDPEQKVIQMSDVKFDANRLDYVSGRIVYTDSKLSVNFRALFEYSWRLERFHDKSRKVLSKNPYTGQDLRPNEYLLEDYAWEGKNDYSAGLLTEFNKNIQDPNKRRIPEGNRVIHFIPGLHICSQWTTDKKALDAFIREQEVAAPQILEQYKDNLAKKTASAGERQSVYSPPLSIHVPEGKDAPELHIPAQQPRRPVTRVPQSGGSTGPIIARMECVPDKTAVAKKIISDRAVQKLEDQLNMFPAMSEEEFDQREKTLEKIRTHQGREYISTNPKRIYHRLTKSGYQYTAKDYEYKIEIAYDVGKFESEFALYSKKKVKKLAADKFAEVSFSRKIFFDTGENEGIKVFGFYPEQQTDSSRLGFIFGKTSYTDFTIKEITAMHLTYNWILYRTLEGDQVEINPYSGRPLAANEYLLVVNGWAGNDQPSDEFLSKKGRRSRDILSAESGIFPPEHQFHVLPGIQTCTKWSINGQEVKNEVGGAAATDSGVSTTSSLPGGWHTKDSSQALTPEGKYD